MISSNVIVASNPLLMGILGSFFIPVASYLSGDYSVWNFFCKNGYNAVIQCLIPNNKLKEHQ